MAVRHLKMTWILKIFDVVVIVVGSVLNGGKTRIGSVSSVCDDDIDIKSGSSVYRGNGSSSGGDDGHLVAQVEDVSRTPNVCKYLQREP